MGKSESIISLAEVQRSRAQAAFPPGDNLGSFGESPFRRSGPFAGLFQPDTSQVDCCVGKFKKGKNCQESASWRGSKCASFTIHGEKRSCLVSSRVVIPTPGSLKIWDHTSGAFRIRKGGDVGSVVHRPIRSLPAAPSPWAGRGLYRTVGNLGDRGKGVVC